MDLYQTPGGVWCGTQADWSKAMKAEGFEPKHYTGRRQVTVPTAKKELMEFLSLYSVNCIEPGGPAADVTYVAAPVAPTNGVQPTTMPPLDDLFSAAPIQQQLDLAVAAIDRANAALRR